jgi:hypothetical protein
LKLLAHTDSNYRPSTTSQPAYSSARLSSVNTYEKDLTQSRPMHTRSLKTDKESSNEDQFDSSAKANDDSEQQPHEDSH